MSGMAHDSFEDIAVALVAKDRSRAQWQARDIAARLAHSARHVKRSSVAGLVPYTQTEAEHAQRARDCLIRELLKH